MQTSGTISEPFDVSVLNKDQQRQTRTAVQGRTIKFLPARIGGHTHRKVGDAGPDKRLHKGVGEPHDSGGHTI